MSTEHSDPWIGSTIDRRYTIRDRVARGGMSTVYLAHDDRLDRDVALKVLFPHMAEDRKVVDRFEQEARNAALIAHDNVVRILDQGQTRETAYLVMEHVPGATLRTLLKRGPMTPRLALTYAEAILQGLAAAHRAGLVHRDIKPENVLVSRDGRIKLADFGLARAATHHSGTSTLMGTVAYISPELLSGEGADERADIYAVGILLHEMLTGTQPFVGDSPVRVAFQHVNSTVPAPSTKVPGLAAEIDELVLAATRPQAADRPADADAMLALMHRLVGQLDAAQLDFAGAATAGGSGRDDADGSGADGSGADESDADDAGAGEATTVLSSPSEQDAADSPQATSVLGPREELPAAEDDSAWDEDIDTALLHARSGATLAVGERQTVAEVPTEAFRPETGSPAGRPADRGAPAAPAAARPAEDQAAAPDAERHHDDPYTATSSLSAVRSAPRAAPDAAEETSTFSAVGGSPRRDPPRESISAFGRIGDRISALRRRDPRAVERRERQRPTVSLRRTTTTVRWLTLAILLIGTALVILLAWYIGLSAELVPSLGAGGAVRGGAPAGLLLPRAEGGLAALPAALPLGLPAEGPAD